MKKLLTGLALSGLVLLAHAGNKEDIANAMKAGQWQDAQARLEQVLTQHPENAQAHYWMAETHYRLGQYPQAKAQLDEALRLDPEHKFTNNPKALAALQNRLKSVGGPSSPAPQAQAGQGPALPQAQAPVTREAQAAANPPAKKSGTSWFTWLLIGGAIIVETVYAVPGLGSLMIGALLGRDYYVVQGLTLVFAFATVLVTLTVDLLTALIDPRVRL